MKKIMLLVLIISLLPLVVGAGDNWKLYFSDGITTINGTDVCVSGGQCLTDAANASGDITAVNTDGDYLTGGDVSGVVSLLLNETVLNSSIDARASGLGDNSSWNETYANTLYIIQTSEGDLNVNRSNYWDEYNTTNSTWFQNIAGALSLKLTQLTTWIDNWLSGKDTDDLSEGSTNLYDNQSWNQTLATSLYADISVTGDNSSWNETYADSLYVNITGDTMTGNLTTSKWFNGKFNWTTTDEWSSFDGSTFDFNESQLETTYFLANATQVVTGTGSGTLADIQTYNRTTYNVTEDSSDFELRVNFTGITEFTTLLVRHKTSVSNGHTASIQIWDYGDSTWEGYGYLSEVTTSSIQTLGVYDDADHIGTGADEEVVQVRFYQDESPGSSHIHQFDWVGLSKGFGTPVGQEIDPLSIHKDGATPLTGNWDVGDFNVTVSKLFDDDGLVTGDNSSFNETMGRAIWQEDIGSDCSAGDFVKGVDDDGTLDCDTPAGGGDITGVNTTLDYYLYNGSDSGDVYLRTNGTRLNATMDARDLDTNASTSCSTTEVLLGNGTCYNSTLFYDDTTISDTNETSFVNNLTTTDCSVGNLVIGIQNNGTVLCAVDAGNSSFNQSLTDTLYRADSWDNITGIPHATPSDGDTTHFSLADEIYDWVIGLVYATETYVDNLVATYTHLSNWTDDLGDRGYTHLTNFTDDILWTSGFNTTLNSSIDLRDDDTTYTAGNLLYLSTTEFNINNTELNASIEAYGYITTDTNASTACSGSTTYLDGEGNCDNISSVYEAEGAHFDISTTVNITCFDTACDFYSNATDSCLYWPSGGKDCGAA